MIRPLLLAGAAWLAGCAQLELGAPVPALANIQAARAAAMAPVGLGPFTLAEGRPPSMDRRLTARTNTLLPPGGRSFAGYLRATLQADLEAAGLYDPASTILIEGRLTENRLDVPSGLATGSVAARFVVKREGAVVYDKELRASAQWHASFPAVEAVPGAMNQYGLLHRSLVTKLLADDEFRAATRR